MDFLPLMMMLSGMNKNKDGSSGGLGDMDNMMKQMSEMKEYQDALKNGGSSGMMNILLKGMMKDNPQMKGMSDMMNMMNGMSGTGGAGNMGGFDFSNFMGGNATTESYKEPCQSENNQEMSRQNNKGEYLLPISDIANKDITYILNKFFSNN